MDYSKERNILIDINNICLENIANTLKISEKLLFKVGIEIEFYLTHNDNSRNPLKITDESIRTLSKSIKIKMSELNIEISDIEVEDGDGQFEVQILTINHPVQACDNVLIFKKHLQQICSDMMLNVNFSDKPYQSQPGNAMNINISLYTEKNINVFNNNGECSQIMIYSVGGIMNYIKTMLYISVGDNDQSYSRFIKPVLHQKYINYPTVFAWGFNNRTAAVRIPSVINANQHQRRIEYRLSSSSANPYKLLSAILYSITDGILNKITPPMPIYGNCFNIIYDNIDFIPKNVQDSYKLYIGSKISSIINGDLTNLFNKKYLN